MEQTEQTEHTGRMKILIVTTEAVPFAKEGGVADVMGSLPRELARRGHDVRVFLPRYGTIAPERWGLRPAEPVPPVYWGGVHHVVRLWRGALPDSTVTVYFFDHEHFFGRLQRLYLGQDQVDEQRRFVLFCRGVIEALPSLGFIPDIIHLNDWQTAACAAFLRTTHRPLLRRGQTRIVYTIHNLQYQGRWDPSILDEAGMDRARVFVPDGLEYWGDVNWMKGGIAYADVITTVSRRYAEEIQTLDQGWGLDELLTQRRSRLSGVPNGIDWDAWNPATDPDIAARYEATDAPAVKERDRAALREEMGLPEADLPVAGLVSRLVEQKGIDLIAALADQLRDLPLQLVALGTGQPEYETLFRDLSAGSANVRARIGFDAALSHRIYAGSDFFLMPSAFEPGGLGQLIALRYGTLPIVRATGGLADTVTDLDADPAHGNGFSFVPYEPSALVDALQRALRTHADRERWPALVARAMAYDSRWSTSARAYEDLYRRVLRLPPT
jgi:starch synthase